MSDETFRFRILLAQLFRHFALTLHILNVLLVRILLPKKRFGYENGAKIVILIFSNKF